MTEGKFNLPFNDVMMKYCKILIHFVRSLVISLTLIVYMNEGRTFNDIKMLYFLIF